MKLKYYLRGLGIGIVVTALLMGIVTKDKGVMSDEEIKARAAQLGMVEQRTLADIRDNALPTEAPVVTKEPDTNTSNEAEQPSVEAQVPESTELPAGTQEPELTEAPAETKDTENAGEPTVTENPVNTEEPTVTKEPENTEEPIVTPEPDTTSEPEITPEPMETREPEATEKPTEAEPQQSPEATSEPVIIDQGDTVIIRIRPGDSSEVVSKRLEKAGLVESDSEFNQYLLKKKLTKVINVGTYEIEKGATIKEIAKIITN